MIDGEIENWYDGETLDVTSRVERYENGKTWECDCGQGVGVKYGKNYITCATCGVLWVDRKAGEREPPKMDVGQTKLGEW